MFDLLYVSFCRSNLKSMFFLVLLSKNIYSELQRLVKGVAKDAYTN
ncbi:hypothetical protein AX25_13485 [Listeria ivanovii WSLC3009]|nr:hypothetical protein AX25_13485 [Listeria ivanovii WSLC3009]